MGLKFQIEKKVRQTIKRYSLFERGDKIAVALSGGKDSTVCYEILKNLGYNPDLITIDPGIESFKAIDNLKQSALPIKFISFKEEFGKNLPEIMDRRKEKPCMVCGILKRYLLNKKSKEWGYKALITGHNLDDEAQGFIMNVFRNDYPLAVRQGPVAGFSKTDEFVKRVKPLYFIKESEIISYLNSSELKVSTEPCPMATSAFRRKFRTILDQFEKDHPDVKYNIIKFQEKLRGSAPVSRREFKKCITCGEPSSGDICKACQIINELN